MTTTYDALVVGAGIGGIRSALDLAQIGRKVALIEAAPAMGGLLQKLDHQFPTDHCGMCKSLPLTQRDNSSQFCMRKGLFHRNIDLFLSTELTALDGDPGAFHATLKRRSSFVDPARCIGCGLCAAACPVRVPDEFNAGLTMRPAIHLPVPQAIPNHYVVDLEACERCGACVKACPTGAVDIKGEERARFRVLIAGEKSEDLDRLSALIADMGFPVTHVSGGAQAVEAVAAVAADPEAAVRLVILGPDLGEMAGERLLGRLRELSPHLPVLAAAGERAAAKDLLDAGALEMIELPPDEKRFRPWFDKFFMRQVSDEMVEIDVAAVILAAGFTCFDPTPVGDVLGYGQLPDVVTSLEFERLLSGTGPTGGRLVRRSDGAPVRRIAWLQCVGSRNLKQGDFCSSICCMISIKEANLALKATAGQPGGPAEATVFYMDMRTFGRDHQHYLDQAAQSGINFVRSRIHSVVPDSGPEKGLHVEYMGEDGVLRSERFDLLVLAAGARPPASMARLAEAAGIELNPWGFPKIMPFQPARTSRLGVFAAGSFNGPKDIAESMIQSGAAALGASRLVNLYAPIREKQPAPEPVYADVSRQPSRILVALCTSCPVFGQTLDADALARDLAAMHGVSEVIPVERVCTGPGWESIVEAAASDRPGRPKPNRVIIGACMPYAYVPRLHQLGRRLGLDPGLMDVVDIYSPLMQAAREGSHPLEDAETSLRMAVRKLAGSEPRLSGSYQPVEQHALVVGGGLAGLTAALGVADHGFPVTLVEEQEALGGIALNVRRTAGGEDARKYVEGLVEQVGKHPNIRTFTDARVSLASGRSGHFLSFVTAPQGTMHLLHGATILATGGHEAKVYEWGYRVHKSVMTQQELENKLADGQIDARSLSGVAMIQCWRSREQARNYCSRICCQNAMKNIAELKRRNPELQVHVFYRDIMTYGFQEEMYTEARRLGALFIRYSPDNKPRVEFEEGRPVITAFEPILGRDIQVRADILALASGIEPNDASEVAELFGVPLTEHGFFQEADPKWRPVDFLKHGVFACGLARAPGSMDETIASAKAAAQRALCVLSEKRLVPGRVVAEVRPTLCSRCGTCIEVCPYHARSLDPVLDRIVVDELLCQGCGSCAAACPNGASVLRGFSDRQVLDVIDAALEV
jgi:heterodisulfide reductase subunit A